MKKAVADKWVKALRSGKYKQGSGQLRDGNEFCCLGVLCNLHAQENPKFAAKQQEQSYYGGNDMFPPKIVQNWAGMKTENGKYHSDEYSLATLNDDGKNFKFIADIIEKNWRKL